MYVLESSSMRKRCRSRTPNDTRNIHDVALTYDASSVLFPQKGRRKINRDFVITSIGALAFVCCCCSG
jgi:hypothetical protein